uniref:HAP2-GCS1 domain-containing protein n=1 Tax=Rhabditophanes sp. KR3021 TaxID=114890 RepID=A0AC35TKC9_9BILA
MSTGNGVVHKLVSEDPQKLINIGALIGLHRTLCFTVDESENGTLSLDKNNRGTKMLPMHSLTLIRLEHQYPVTSTYRFAIPEVDTDCKCQCDHRNNVCTERIHPFDKCAGNSGDTSCYKTFFGNKVVNGCEEGQHSSNVCCELSFSPYRNVTYTAVQLGAPRLYAIFKYFLYRKNKDGEWDYSENKVLTLPMNGDLVDDNLGHQDLLKLKIGSQGPLHNFLMPGMYFVENKVNGDSKGQELRQQELNDIESSDMDKLGWYRENTRKFEVVKGLRKIQNQHRVTVENCVEQKYKSILEAEYYVNKKSNEDSKYYIGDTINKKYKWIESATLLTRHVSLTHKEGINIKIHLVVNLTDDKSNHNRVTFVHFPSDIEDFSGEIVTDENSNYYFNVTVYNGTGFISASIKKGLSESDEDVSKFVVPINEVNPVNKTMHIPLNIDLDVIKGENLICLRATKSKFRRGKNVCRIVEYKLLPLKDNTLSQGVVGGQSNCPECNKKIVNDFVKYLNPGEWYKNAKTWDERALILGTLAFYTALAICLILLLRTCLPVFKGLFSLMKWLFQPCCKSK